MCILEYLPLFESFSLCFKHYKYSIRASLQISMHINYTYISIHLLKLNSKPIAKISFLLQFKFTCIYLIKKVVLLIAQNPRDIYRGSIIIYNL